jgi:metal-responsive CopG/Arc/MetJ family transcriptional regulator
LGRVESAINLSEKLCVCQVFRATVHIPSDLLEAVDARAKRMKLSRNRFVVDALKKALADRSEWAPGFISAISKPLAQGDAVDEMMRSIKRARSSKKAPKL